ncbi:N-acetylmuramoyl-L-alanine amidase [Planctomycetota bacterium]|nr:N-acetylmuramoyl-L-alanine amidase [Planctomycetota bacterium]
MKRRSTLRRTAPLVATLGLAAVAAVQLETTASAVIGGGGAPRRIFVDAGHGGIDPGAVGNGVVEKELNLEVALRLRDLLEADTADTSGGGEWEVMMTRTDDASVSLASRTNAANNWPADRFVSIHHNAFTSSLASGTETFSFSNGTPGADLRDRLQEELLNAMGFVDRGPKTANFYVLRETLMPAALTEAGFLSNPGDAAALSAPGAVEALALAHLFGIQRHYGMPPHVPVDGPSTYCFPKTASAGCVPSIEAAGTPSVSQSDFVVACDQVLSQQFGMLFWGREGLELPLLGGFLCVGGPLMRTPVQFSNGLGPGNCSGRLELQMDSGFLNASGMLPGDEIFCQWWYRDPGLLPAAPIGLSDGLKFTVLP